MGGVPECGLYGSAKIVSGWLCRQCDLSRLYGAPYRTAHQGTAAHRLAGWLASWRTVCCVGGIKLYCCKKLAASVKVILCVKLYFARRYEGNTDKSLIFNGRLCRALLFFNIWSCNKSGQYFGAARCKKARVSGLTRGWAARLGTGDNPIIAGLFSASLSMLTMQAFGFSISLCHVFAFFCLPIVLITFAMIDLA